jgi:aminoglycoside 6'-N-acetyltransferase I
MAVTIEPMSAQSAATRRRAAAILVEAFAGWPESWDTLEEAEEEVAASLGDDRLSFVALASGGEPLGWIGGIPTYRDRVWELHPLAVTPHAQRAGVGRRLVQRLEGEAAARGGLTVYLGTDDVTGMTTLGGRDLYPGVLAHLAGLRDLSGHPFAFYQHLGYEVVGVVPDANGFGRPDIMMAKRIGRDPVSPR